MATSVFACQPPEPFDFTKTEDWPRWKQRFERFRAVSGLHNKPATEQVNTLIYCMGEKAEDILLSLRITADQSLQYEAVKKAFEDHFIVRRNIIYDRSKFHTRKQEENEPVENFITYLHALAKYCNFGALHDEMIRDRIVVGVQDRKLSEKMQLDAKLTFESATAMARQSETVKNQQDALHGADNVNRVQSFKAPALFRETPQRETHNNYATGAAGRNTPKKCQEQ